MQNVMSYISSVNPQSFDYEAERMVKVQIENSLELGWKKDEILIVTDFPYSYNGIEAIVMNHKELRVGRRSRGFNKVLTILHLYEQKLIKDGVFFHDLDAFQNIEFFDCPDKQYHKFKLSVAGYGDDIHYNAGCMFFGVSALEIWKKIYSGCIQFGTDEEKTLNRLYPSGKQSEVGMLDISYNVGKGETTKKFASGFQPSRIIHFHPAMRGNYSYYVQGNNDLKKPLVCERVGRLITKHFR